MLRPHNERAEAGTAASTVVDLQSQRAAHSGATLRSLCALAQLPLQAFCWAVEQLFGRPPAFGLFPGPCPIVGRRVSADGSSQVACRGRTMIKQQQPT